MGQGSHLRFRERFLMVGAAGGLAALMLAALLWLAGARPAQAAGVVGNGDPGSCTQATLASVLANGGLVTFNCGASPKTILLSSQQVITQDTTIDGGGLITLDGAGVTRVFTISTGVSMTIANLTISNGAAGPAEAGGAIYSSGSLTIQDSSFISNTAATAGAILSLGPVTLTGTTMMSNTSTGTSGNGGAMIVFGGPAQVSASTFRGNSAANFGGAVSVDSSGLVSVTVTDSEFTANRVLTPTGRGGALYIDGGAGTIENTWFEGNAAESDATGGALYLSNSTFTIEASTFLSNTAERGGGINLQGGALTVTTSSFLSNAVSGFGGGLNQSSSSLVMHDSVVTGNTSDFSGGGLRLGGSSSAVSIVNTTISGNTANTGEGGGLEQTVGTLLITNSTIVSNTAVDMTGGNIIFNALLTATNTILAFGSPNNCTGDAIGNGGNNLQFGGTVANSCGATIAIVDPLLGPLQNNGGPTLTHALRDGSPAIDGGSDEACPATDQRGAPRPVDGNNNNVATCDIGAYELSVRVMLPLILR